MLVSVRDANVSGAARRLQRRLRQWLGHERLSVAMPLAEYTTQLHGDRRFQGPGETPLTRAAQYFSLDDDGDVLAARPLALDEQRPQVRVLRRTVEQIGDVVPLVPALADSTPQMVDQLVTLPTILFFLKQTVDTRGRSGGPQVFSQNRVLRLLWRRSLTFQLQVVVIREVFKVFPKNGVPQRLVEQHIVFSSSDCRVER